MSTVPNQRTITIVKEPADKSHLYTIINLNAMSYAAQILQSKAGYKLWTYMAKNQNKYSFALSSSDFCQWAGVRLTAYRTAFNELVENGFLIQSSRNKSNYTFYEKPNYDQQGKTITTENNNNTLNSLKSPSDHGFKF